MRQAEKDQGNRQRNQSGLPKLPQEETERRARPGQHQRVHPVIAQRVHAEQPVQAAQIRGLSGAVGNEVKTDAQDARQGLVRGCRQEAQDRPVVTVEAEMPHVGHHRQQDEPENQEHVPADTRRSRCAHCVSLLSFGRRENNLLAHIPTGPRRPSP